MVRLKDIAAQAGVSVMTVSKALRGASDISAQTTARIRTLAQQMGYVPDTMAQALRNRTTKLLGLVLPTVANPIFARTISAIEERAHDLGYDLVLSHTLNLPEREEAAIRRLIARRVDGVFVCPVYRLAPSVPIYNELALRGTPTVILGHRAPFCSQFTSIATDDVRGSYLITQHLIELGHRNIAFFSGPLTSPAAQERLEGYRRALREAQIEVNDRLLFTAGSTIEEGECATVQLLKESPEVTAIQAANDLVAIGAGNILLNRGIKIPDQLSIAGFGNILISEHYRVPLTTVRQPKLRLGSAAMETMQKLIRGEKPEPIRLPAELVIRASTAPPHAS